MLNFRRRRGANLRSGCILACIALVAGCMQQTAAQQPEAPRPLTRAETAVRDEALLARMFAQRSERAPSFDGGVSWINAGGPIDLKELRGKFVVVDFWTFCCINCMHILPELKRLEHAYPKNLVVVGVHSAKFEAEQDSDNIAEAVLRYEIEHPVVNDAHQAIWNRYDVKSWPTIVLIDPEGYVLYKRGGEFKAEQFAGFLNSAIPFYRKKGLLDETPLRFDLERYRTAQTPLRFPGKIVADEKNNRLFISDSNHNRIVVARLDGTLLGTIGSGAAGMADGDFNSTQFNRPQGMALDGDTLYVADTENHLLRKVDLKAERVVTVAGTGRQAENGWPGWNPAEEPVVELPGGRIAPAQRFVGPSRSTALSTPWDLWINDRNLYIAMAGTHQIWRMPLDASEIGPYAGNSREDIVDGPRLPRQPYGQGFASFAQPSGLTSDGKWLYVADSEGSSIRAVPFNERVEVKTVLGTAEFPTGRLFTFGDVDGPQGKARLQHPLGVAWHDGRIYIADTYNNKIKVLDPTARTVTTLAGSGRAGDDDAQGKPGTAAAFNEPSGLAVADGKLFVADTNNHRIRTIDLSGNHAVATLAIVGLAPPVEPQAVIAAKPKFEGAEQVKLAAMPVKPQDGAFHLAVRFELPDGYHMNPQAPMRYYLQATGGAALADAKILEKFQQVKEPAAKFDVRIPVTASSGEETLKLSMNYYYCQEGEAGLCKIGSVSWTIPVQLSTKAKTSTINVPLTVKE
jgi:thiol-disulfide isomerase/thioredoxin